MNALPPEDFHSRKASLAAAGARPDHLLLADMVTPGARVLDVGCGDGSLLALRAICKIAMRAASNSTARM